MTTNYDQAERIITLLLQAPTIAKQTKQPKQDKWKTAAINFYGAGEDGTATSEDINGNMRFNRVWCPIWQEYAPKDQVAAAHIIPHLLSTKVTSYLLGSPSEEEDMWSVRNCLPMSKELELGMDKGYFVLVPVGGTRTTAVTNYQYRLVDESVRKTCIARGKTTWGDFDNRVLLFKNDNRPAGRYLYLRFVLTILSAREMKWKGWNDTWKFQTGTVWGTPSRWIRKSFLKQIAASISDYSLPEELEEGTFGEDEAPATPRLNPIDEATLVDMFTAQRSRIRLGEANGE